MASQTYNGIHGIKRVHPLLHSLTNRFSSSSLPLKSKPQARILSSELRIRSSASSGIVHLLDDFISVHIREARQHRR
ncbi:unnamed protein product [Microthlaspi erraticum]|uniref:Uncharacterized protein n=1 Tax=Microthlaspi erraticum TaxID=1685480 RepID=A0A6D2LGM3_9BRAS|nr:unnamed protein product [Microthlaspi erraticum]